VKIECLKLHVTPSFCVVPWKKPRNFRGLR